MTIIGAVAELERAKILERNIRGRNYRLKQGQLVSNGSHLFGYTYVRKTNYAPPRLEIQESEAEIIRSIFETYAKGNVSTYGIAKQLNAKNIQARIKLQDFNIKKILGNETYTGIRYFNTMMVTRQVDDAGRKGKRMVVPRDRSEWIGVPVPAIISKKLFDEAQKRLKYNSTCFRNARGTQPLSNLVLCGVCKERGHTFRKYYVVKRKREMTWYHHRFFQCGKNRNKSHNLQIDGRLLEHYVREVVRDSLIDPLKLRGCLTGLGANRDKGKKIKKQLEQGTHKLADLESQQKRIVDLYARGGMEHEAYYQWMLDNRDEIDVVKAAHSWATQQLPFLKEPELIERSVARYCSSIKKRFETCYDFASWRQFFLDFIESVEYSKNDRMLRIAVRGLVPVTIESEEVKVGFTVRKNISAEDATALLRKIDSQEPATHGERILRSKYNRLTLTV